MCTFVAKWTSGNVRFWRVHIDTIESWHDVREPGERYAGNGSVAATMSQPVKIGEGLHVRDCSRCILCYKRGRPAGPSVRTASD